MAPSKCASLWSAFSETRFHVSAKLITWLKNPGSKPTSTPPGTGFALLVIAFCLLLQTIPSAICVLTPSTGWDPDGDDGDVAELA